MHGSNVVFQILDQMDQNDINATDEINIYIGSDALRAFFKLAGPLDPVNQNQLQLGMRSDP